MNVSYILDRFTRLRILVIGDLMVDHYIWGDVNRISPEAPVPVVHVSRESYTAGGAANVALNLASLGIRAELIGALGEDSAGQRLRTLLATARIDAQSCVTIAGASTIVKTRVMARTQQLCRIDHEGAPDNYALESERVSDAQLSEAIATADAVIISDYAKGAITQALLNRVLKAARVHGKLVAVDPKPSRHLVFGGVGLITPNRHETLEMADLPEPRMGEPYPLEEACRRIQAKFSPDLLVITLGAGGMAVCRNGKVEHVMPTEAQEVFDVSGAGDTVIATLTAALAAGCTATDAARLANKAAGVVVAKMGTATASPSDLLKLAA
jgi:D-beta-D-heptose 7-phosphate kinase/D-beta-D-heptose 1-phosphate adenosyltransferase